MIVSGATGNVGIGTTSPGALLHVSSGASGVSAAANSQLIIEGSVSRYLQFALPSSSTGGILFGDSANSSRGSITYQNSTAAGTPDAMDFSTAGNFRMRINATGNVGIGNTGPTYKLDVTGDINTTTRLRIAGTEICTVAGCTSSSDKRLKENIQPLENALENILSLQGVEYDYRNKEKFGTAHQIGVIAQDVEKVYPEVVKTDSETGLKSVAYDHLVAPLIEAVKALYNRIVGVEDQQATQARQIASKADQEALNVANAEIQNVKAENKKLKTKNQELEQRLEKIERMLNSK
jgi:hypothetical protein